jgi:CubicO group peptidase (beta-lactamase class C family)
MDIVKPESVGLSSSRLQRVNDWLDEQISMGRFAGASVLVARKGSTAMFAAAGQAEVESKRPFDMDTIVRIYSMTKPITTVAAMMLHEQGLFRLDDPIALYLPEFADTPVWSGGDSPIDSVGKQQTPITVRHLMTHTSGLTYDFFRNTPVDAYYRDNQIAMPGADAPLAEMSQRVARAPLLFQPGSQWNYGVSTDILGRLVEVWSGTTLDKYFSGHIFAPLGMNDTGFHVAPGNADRFAALYKPGAGGDMSSVGQVSNDFIKQPTQASGVKVMESASESRYLQPATLFSGGGGLTGSITDYARFCQMLLNGGELDGKRLLGRKTVEHMRQNHLPENKDMAAMGQPVWSETSYDGIGFGLGFAVVIDPVKANIVTSPGEHHWGGAASTFFWCDPTESLYTVFFAQLMPSSTYPVRQELRTLVYQAITD